GWPQASRDSRASPVVRTMLICCRCGRTASISRWYSQESVSSANPGTACSCAPVLRAERATSLARRAAAAPPRRLPPPPRVAARRAAPRPPPSPLGSGADPCKIQLNNDLPHIESINIVAEQAGVEVVRHDAG